MRNTKLIILAMIIISLGFKGGSELNYPVSQKVDTVENYHGAEIADPYRWLENLNSDETQKWIEAQNNFTDSYLSKITFRQSIKKRLTEIWDYEKYNAPTKVGSYYFFSKNDGLQEQSVVYYQSSIDGEAEVFLDPNKFSDDGSVSLAGLYFSDDSKYCGYAISKGGSDWREFFVLDIDTKSQREDHIKWVKFSGMAWHKDGFFYSRYDEPTPGEELKAKNEFQKLYYHKLGSPQSDDILILEDKDNPRRGFGAEVTEDQKYLIISAWEGSATYNLLFFKDLEKDGDIKPVFTEKDAKYNFIGNIGDKFLIQTDLDAPKEQLALVDPQNPAKENWKIIIPEGSDPIRSVSFAGGKLIVNLMKDAYSKISVYDTGGKYLYEVKLPDVGTAGGFYGKQDQSEVFYTFTSFTYPGEIFRYDIEKNQSSLFRRPEVKFDPAEYKTTQVFYSSKDGTKVPMFLVHKKDLELNGNNPALLYGYGGFNIAIQPSFRLAIIPLLENGFVFASACLRGGSEYGEEWHSAGMLDKKQNVFDDFISAAEYLIGEKYTSNKKLAVWGGSNGGLLVGAVINQRPELFRAAIPAVGVMDMLRFHKFTIGWAWVSEYGSSDDPEQFKYLYKYSPLHNVNLNAHYPSVLITTADHDDRVFPAHSFKYAAAMQENKISTNPAMIRIETKVGHGAGTSTSKSIELYTDLWAFLFDNFEMIPKF